MLNPQKDYYFGSSVNDYFAAFSKLSFDEKHHNCHWGQSRVCKVDVVFSQSHINWFWTIYALCTLKFAFKS